MRIRCAARGHRTCVQLRDDLVHEFNNIRGIGAVVPGEGAEDFCLIGTATILERNRARFQRRLGRFRSGRHPGVGVGRALVRVLERCG